MRSPILALFLLVVAPLGAHQPGSSSLLLRLAPGGTLAGEVHLADVDRAAIEAMLRDRANRRGGTDHPAADALPWLRLGVDDAPAAFVPGPPRPATTDGEVHTLIPFEAEVREGASLTIEYADFFAFDPRHVVVVSLETGGGTRVGLLSYDEPRWTFAGDGAGAHGGFATFLREGVWHIWIGIDHILFLVALLLPSVLVRREGRWAPVPRFRAALVNVVKVVTAFTIAHSLTLSLASLALVAPPGRLVESVIAFSVLLAALNNLRPVVSGRAWVVAFGFGLVHGFGFASVLADLGLPAGTLAVALFAFNLGVELGQLAIVAVFFPLAFAARATGFYQPVVLRLGSGLIGAIAAGWMVQRVFDLEVMPF